MIIMMYLLMIVETLKCPIALFFSARTTYTLSYFDEFFGFLFLLFKLVF